MSSRHECAFPLPILLVPAVAHVAPTLDYSDCVLPYGLVSSAQYSVGLSIII